MVNLRLLRSLAATFALTLGALVAPSFAQPAPQAAPAAPAGPTKIREIFVPFADLNVLLEADAQRIFLTRAEYEALLSKARRDPRTPPPRAATLLAARYDARVEEGRARIAGKLELEVLDEGLQALPLELSGVGVRSATLDGRPAPLVRNEQGPPLLLVQGLGRKTLELELVAPMETSAAWQSLHAQLPRPAAFQMRLEVPGNVEVKSGADVLRRVVEGEVTRFELFPRAGEPLVMSLNNRQLLQQRVVLARSVVVDEVTQAYERLHASVSLSILRGAVDSFRFEIPAGFDVSEVDTPLLARWAVVEAAPAAKPEGKPEAAAAAGRVLEVTLREPTTEPVRVNLTTTRLAPALDAWTLPRFQPLDVASHVAVVGLLVDERLKFDSLVARQLIAVDAATITAALPASVLAADASAPRVRAAAAYYAPQSDFALSARFAPPPARLNVTSNALLVVDERGLQLRGGFELRPEIERLFAVDFTVPGGWHVTQVKGADGQPLPFERFPHADGRSRLHVSLQPSVAPGGETRISFEAEAAPEGWIGDWKGDRREVTFPACTVLGAQRDEGALAVHAGEDLLVRPGDADRFRHVTPLDANEKARFGLGNVPSDLVYRYEGADYSLAFVAERARPVITARSYSFLKVEAENLAAHYELTFSIDRAGARRLAFWLPATTPESVVIRGLDGVVVKEYAASQVTDEDGPSSPAPGGGAWRRWTVQLAAKARDKVRLAVDLQQRLPAGDFQKFALPLVRADERVATYQSGLLAVEGSAELDVAVSLDGEGPGRPKRIDVGELAQADYVPGRRLLGAFGFVGDNPAVSIDVFRRPAHALPAALAQRAELVTLVSRSGLTQTAARYQFRTKELFLELELPKGASLWSAYLDGQPLAPQRSGDSLLLSLTAAPADRLRDVQVVYEAPIRAFTFRGRLQMIAPTLRLRNEDGERGDEVQVADLQWQLVLPSGYRLTNSGGTVSPDMSDATTLRQLALRRSPWFDLAAAPLVVATGVRHAFRADYSSTVAFRGVHPLAADSESFAFREFEAKGFLESAKTANEVSDFAQTAPQAAAGMGGYGMGAGGGPMPGAGYALPGPGGPPVGGGMPGMPGGSMPQTAAPKSEPADSRVTLDDAKGGGVPARNALGQGLEGRSTGDRGRLNPSLRDMAGAQAGDRPRTPRTAAAGEGAAETPPAAKEPAAEAPREESGRTDPKPASPGKDDLGDGESSLKRKSLWALEGVRSLPIELTRYVQDGDRDVATFRSLGVAPRLEAALVQRQQLGAIAWSAALILFLYGVAITGAGAGRKTRLVAVTLALVTVAPLLGVWVQEAATIGDHVFWAAIALVGWYLLVALARRVSRPGSWRVTGALRDAWRRRFGRPTANVGANAAPVAHEAAAGESPSGGGASSATLATLLLALLAAAAAASAFAPVVSAQEPAAEPQHKIVLPEDAILVPYNPDDPLGARRAERVLVPLKKYQELWALANPERAKTLAEAARLPASFAWSGARYEASLAGTDDLVLRGTFDLEVFAGGIVEVPLALDGGVITSARLDGRPASLGLKQIGPAEGAPAEAAQQAANQQAAPPQPPAAGRLVTLAVAGPARRQLVITIGLKLQRRGGWRAAEARLPVAPSTALVLTVPDAKTEVRLGDVFDRGRYETTQPNEKLETVVRADGVLNLQWRPKVAEAEVDKSLTVNSSGDVELREDAVRIVWQVNLEFPRSRRETFSVYLPGDYLLERVLGDNIRGWNVVADEGRQRLDVTLLKAAADHESFALVASRRGRLGDGALAEFPLPAIEVAGAALHQGAVSLARSRWLDVRLADVRGLDRTDLPAVRTAEAVKAVEESPLGVQPYQALRFASSAYAATLRITPLAAPPSAELRTVWKIDPREMAWETQVVFSGGQRPTYQVRLAIPETLAVDHVAADGLLDWAITTGPEGRLLTAYLAAGATGSFPVVLRGRLPAPPQDGPTPIPRLKVLDVAGQDGHVVVQVDPSVDVRTERLDGLEPVLMSRTFGWLGASQRGLARLALRVAKPDYAGALLLVRREPRVTASTVTNVRVTGRSIEETILVDFRIEEAGVRRASFLLPAWMRDARVTAPLLREKKVADAPPRAGSTEPLVRVDLDLQDEVMGSFRVLVEHDRLLTSARQLVPIPTIETGRTEQRLVAIESSGRDELAFDDPEGLESLNPQQQAWKRLVELFGRNVLAGYAVQSDAADPRLAYRLRDRQAVETVGARIGLAETQLEVDEHGAYRAKQTFYIDNGTEQFLEVTLPADAKLWTAVVAGEPVKPQQVPGADDRQVRVPIVKTAAGDLDYSIELTYGGRMPSPGAWGRLRFPLMKATNINVELSRVRLLLPATHRWFQFDGTLGRVDQRGKYEASFLEYQTKQLSRLSELLQDKSQDDLRRLRLTNNLKQLGMALQTYNSTQGRVDASAGNDEYTRNLSTLNSVLQKTEQQVAEESAQQQVQLATPQSDDNRTKLNAYFQRQEASRASNVVGQLGKNFDDATAIPATKAPAGAVPTNPFNDKWFDANGLALTGDGRGKSRIMDEAAAKKDAVTNGRAAGGKGVKATNDELREQIEDLQKANAGQRRFNRALDESQELNRRYQQRLQQQTQQGGQGQLPQSSAGAAANAAPTNAAPVVAPPQQDAAPREPAAPPVPTKPGESREANDLPKIEDEALPEPAAPTGLASLIVELPGRGQEYLFTTPRGELELTAYAVNDELLGRTLRLVGVLAVLVVLGLIARVFRRS